MNPSINFHHKFPMKFEVSEAAFITDTTIINRQKSLDR